MSVSLGNSLLLCALLCSGCATLTDRSVAYPDVVYRDPAVNIESRGEPLDPAASERVIDKVVGDEESSEALGDMLAVEEAITGKPLVAGNRVKLLVDGPSAYAEMFKALRTAKHHIHLETFVLADDHIGRSIAQVLLDKIKEGVKVRIIYDAFGSDSTSNEFIEYIASKGVQLHEYRPLNPFKEPLWKIGNRDHRKILVIDGRIGFTGGMNVSGVYSNSSFSTPESEPSLEGRWRDTHVRIDGPAVAELQRLFLRQWAEQRPEDAPAGKTEEYFPKIEPKGKDLIRVIASDGGDGEYEIYDAYLAAIEHARECIWVTQAYFAPNHEMLEALEDAAKRGVDVRVLVPGFTDRAVVLNASRAEYSDLLKSGVRIFERGDAMVHAKTAVIDGVWSTVGSSNFDYMSFLHNSEANAVIVSREFGRQMKALYEFDQRHAREIDPETWRDRPYFARVVEKLSRLFTYWI